MKESLNYFDALQKETRDKCAEKYRELILLSELGQQVDWPDVNHKILSRWSMSGLVHIKERAFLRRTENGRVWVTAKNRELEWDAFMVNVRDFWQFARVGFGSYQEAILHCENLRKTFRLG